MTIAAIALALLAAGPVSPAASDDEVWALARKVNKAGTYETYLLRFPAGRHRDTAIRRFYRVRRLPVGEAPERPWSPRLAFMRTSPLPRSTPCDGLPFGQAPTAGQAEEFRDYRLARIANRPEGYRAHIAKYPGGACAEEADYELRLRQSVRGRFRPVPGFGPLAPHPLMPMSVLYNVEDYPARARRNRESGRVVVGFEVAEDGFVEGCNIVRSSGSALLDETSCRLIARRQHYDPARNRAGAPVRSTDRQTFDWVLPPG